jgi:hypothetical protein
LASFVSDATAGRYFSVAEANAMIKDLELTFARMLQMKVQVRLVYACLEEAGFAPGADDFEIAPPGASAETINNLTSLKTLIDALRVEVSALKDAGCLIKDIDEGIVDWPASRGGCDVLLCWKLGEKEVAFWHDPEAGFAGRRPISELEGGDIPD